jgi:hypothetical protein
MGRTCKICGATNEAASFYDGVSNRCAECHKRLVRENRAAKIEYYRKYDADRFQNDPRVKARIERYAATDAGKASLTRSREKWLEANTVKRAAHIILNNAVKNGKIEKPNSCSICGAIGRIHGHHDDYSLPLAVVWCCSKCHRKIHESQ